MKSITTQKAIIEAARPVVFSIHDVAIFGNTIGTFVSEARNEWPELLVWAEEAKEILKLYAEISFHEPTRIQAEKLIRRLEA